MPFIAVLVANSDTLSNTSQVLKSECLARDNGFLYQRFAYLVIGVLLETLLTSAHLFQATFCRTGTHALQEVTAVVIAHTSFMDFGTAKHLTCTIGSKVDHPQINAKSIRSFGQWRRILALGDVEVVGAIAPKKVSTANLPGGVNKHLVLTLAKYHTTCNTPLHGVEGYAIKTHQAVGTSIVADRAMWPKLWTRFTFLDVCGSDRLYSLRARTHCQLSTQPETSTGLPIDPVMRRIGVGNTFLPTHRGNPRGRRIKVLLRFLQSGAMTVYVKLNAHCPYECFIHRGSRPQAKVPVKRMLACGRLSFLPALKERGFQKGTNYEFNSCRAVGKQKRTSLHLADFSLPGVGWSRQ